MSALAAASGDAASDTVLAQAWRAMTGALRWWGPGNASGDLAPILAEFVALAGSPAALLWQQEGPALALTARFRWPRQDMPLAPPLEECAMEGLLQMPDGEGAVLALIHGAHPIGAIQFAAPYAVDGEATEALVLAARQFAAHLAARRALQSLADGARMGDFHRRFAFAAHDIKGLASQLSLLAANAERHGDDPAFRADMLVTLRAASQRMVALLAQLRSDGAAATAKPAAAPEGFNAADLARAIERRFRPAHPVTVLERDSCHVAAPREVVEQVLTHLVQNGIEASAPDSPVFIHLSADGGWCRVEIVDSGHGMAEGFVRDALFRPFASSKPQGMGLGAYEARELVRSLGGDLQVESQEGVGTRFVIRLPRAAAGSVLVA